MVGQLRSLMELERKKGTSHDCLKLAMFSKLVVKYPTQFFFSCFSLAAVLSSVYFHLCFLLFASCSSLPSPFLPLGFRGSTISLHFKEFSCFRV